MCSDMTVEKRPLVGLWVDGELWKILNTTFYRILDWKGRQVVWPDTRAVNGLREISQCRESPETTPTMAFSLLKAPTRAFTAKNLLRHYTKWGVETWYKGMQMGCLSAKLHWQALWNFSKLTVTPLADTGRSPAGAKTVIILMFMTSSSHQPGQVREQGNCENDNERRI